MAYRFGTKIEDLDVFEAVLAPAPLLFDVPAVVALVVVAKVIAETIAHRQPVKAWFNVSQWALAAAVGAVTFGHLDNGPGLEASELAALVVALLAVAVVNHAALGGRDVARDEDTPRGSCVTCAPLSFRAGSWAVR